MNKIYLAVITGIFVVLPKTINAYNDMCPDGAECPAHQTCCLLLIGNYGCCPFKDAFCCNDKLHCCPGGSTCDLISQTCHFNGVDKGYKWLLPLSNSIMKPRETYKESNKIEDFLEFAKNIETELKISDPTGKCPDGSNCPVASTCCSGRETGTYNCCPHTNGVCCVDKITCCPENHICNQTTNTCLKPTAYNVSPSFNFKTMSFSKIEKIPSVIQEEKKIKKENIVPFSFKKVIDLLKMQTTTTCPDGSSCAFRQTCCAMGDQSYGCCIYHQATCCSDLQSCCPNGYTCEATSCRKGNMFIPKSKQGQSIRAYINV